MLALTTLLVIDLLSAQPSSKSPARAALYSALLPGLGQIYVEQTWKGIALGTAAVSLGLIVWRDYRDSERWMAEFRRSGSAEAEARHREGQRRFLRDLFFLLGVWGYSITDAYVSCEFFRFDEQNKAVLQLALCPPRLVILL